MVLKVEYLKNTKIILKFAVRNSYELTAALITQSGACYALRGALPSGGAPLRKLQLATFEDNFYEE